MTEIYEGEFENGQYHGTGRRILLPSGAVQEGYFLNGNLVAQSKQIFELQEMFHDYHLHVEQNSTISNQVHTDNAFEVQKYIENGNLTIKP